LIAPHRISPLPFIGCYVGGRRPNSWWRDEVSSVPCGKKLPSANLTFSPVGLDLRIFSAGAVPS
jgi:hypothetical protein